MIDLLSSALDFLAKGGVLMIFIFLGSIVAIAFFVERWIALRTASKQIQRLRPMLKEALTALQFERALTLCDAHPCALSAIAKNAILHRQRTREGIQKTIEDAAKSQYAQLERFIPAIGIVANISPLLGLLGTVTGMIQVFSNLADEYAAGAHANPGMLAGGIWEALLTTAAGLCVAIPAFLMHRYLCAKLDDLWLELETYSTEILDLLAPAATK